MSMDIENQSKRQKIKSSNNIYSNFINLIKNTYQISDIILNELSEDFSFKLTYYEIQPQKIIDEIEAIKFNNNIDGICNLF